VFFHKHRDWLVVFLFFASIVGSVFFLVAIESVFNGGFYFSVRILWLPLALLVFGFTWFNRRSLYIAMQGRWKTWLTALASYPMALLMCWPYIMAINAATSSGEKMVYRGPIKRKWIGRGSRGRFYEIDVLDSSTSQVITLDVSPEKYASLREGDIFTTEFIRGGFGIPYRWRFEPQSHNPATN
jgi:hypothetical protein